MRYKQYITFKNVIYWIFGSILSGLPMFIYEYYWCCRDVVLKHNAQNY